MTSSRYCRADRANSTLPVLAHGALLPAAGVPLLTKQLPDPNRLAVLLQIAVLCSHLQRCDLRIVGSWDRVHIAEDGGLNGAIVGPRPPDEPEGVDLREVMLALFRGGRRIVGRSRARAWARSLLRRWSLKSDSPHPDRVVSQLLGESPLLWSPMFSRARQAIVARRRIAGRTDLIVAGPEWFARRLLAAATDMRSAEETLASPRARRLWTGEDKPARSGVVASATSSRKWQVVVPRSPRQRRLCVRSLVRAGRFNRALELTRRDASMDSMLARAECLVWLGYLDRAAKALRDFECRCSGDQVPSRYVDIAFGIAVRLPSDEWRRFGLEGCREWADSWLAQACEWLTRGVQSLGSALEPLPPCNLASAPNEETAATLERWELRLQAEAALLQGDGTLAVTRLKQLLKKQRRRLSKFEAAEIWDRMAWAESVRGDLTGASRSAEHALRRIEDCDEIPLTAAILERVIGLRLRAGFVDRVDLDRCSDLLRSRGVAAGVTALSVLELRRDLVTGRPDLALARRRRILRGSPGSKRPISPELCLLEARALGWMGHQEVARSILESVPSQEWNSIEEEEHPALWALSGDYRRARAACSISDLGRIWRRVLCGDKPSTSDWHSLSGIEGYRAARMVFDLEMVSPGCVPRRWRERACSTLSGVGAESLVAKLAGSQGPAWKALTTHLCSGSPGSSCWSDLFGRSGYFDARLTWRNGQRATVLVEGTGGSRELIAERPWGELVLQAARVDLPLMALFALAVKEFRPPRQQGHSSRSRAAGIIGDSRALQRSLARLDRLASREMPILLLGETGTGKELMARRAHAVSERARGSFLAVNCAALSETLILSELFGHVRGAFTGAERSRPGVFESADRGTVLLDEIGDLPLSAQGKLLRVIQEGEVRRLGESHARKVDVRLIAATHRDLKQLAEQGRFRSDLYYRIAVGTVELPPLRERGDDVVLLARHFVESRQISLTREAERALTSYSWPGNVRELLNVLSVAEAIGEGSEIQPRDLEIPQSGAGRAGSYHRQVDHFRRQLVQEALASERGSRAAAARRLDLSRQAFSYLIERFGIE